MQRSSYSSPRLIRLGTWTCSGRPRICSALLVMPPTSFRRLAYCGLGPNVVLHHPLVRSACYRLASLDARRSVHGALAEAVDP